MNHIEGLTQEEIEKIDQAAKDIGDFGSIEIIKSKDTIDIIQSKRIRIRNGKNQHKNVHNG